MSQLSFEFTSAEDARSQDGLPETAAGLTLEEMAQRLQAHPDYRVLRRLVPVTDYGPRPDAPGATAQGLRVLVLDTETTGLSHASDRIIELAMLLVQVDAATGQPFGPVETFEGFEDPGMPIPEVAKQVTGISDDMVRGQRLDDAQVQALIDRADLVVAHNAGFDRPFVEARFPGFAHKPWACSFADIDWKALGPNRPSSARWRRTRAGSTTRTARWWTAMPCCRCCVRVMGAMVTLPPAWAGCCRRPNDRPANCARPVHPSRARTRSRAGGIAGMPMTGSGSAA
jgi:DNA polymerase III epsilon subunit-like protein